MAKPGNSSSTSLSKEQAPRGLNLLGFALLRARAVLRPDMARGRPASRVTAVARRGADERDARPAAPVRRRT